MEPRREATDRKAEAVQVEPWAMVENRGRGRWPVAVTAPRILVPDHFGRGRIDVTVSHAGFQCCVMEGDLERACTLHAGDPSPEEDLVAFGCAVVLEGGAGVTPEGLPQPVTLRPGDFVLHHSAEPRMKVGFEASRMLFVNAGFSIKFLRDLASDLDLPPPLRSMVERGRAEPFALRGRLDGRIRLLMEEIRRAPYTQGALRLHHQAKSLELLAHLAHTWSDRGPGPSRRWNGRDIDRLHDARRRLLRDLEQPPTLTELAALVGLSPTKLKLGFRDVFDTTVSDTLREARLQAAGELLARGDLPLKTVAHQVGFCDAASLSHAFKTRFGVTPGRFRR